jgi:hypothetical protein
MHMGTRAGSKDSAALSSRQKAQARELAVAAFEYIAQEPRRLARFLDLTGIALESIREASREANFLAGVLDHVSEDEALLLAFCEQSCIDPQEVVRARAILSGTAWEQAAP